MFDMFLVERRTGMADSAFDKRIDQNKIIGQKLLQLGIGEDKLDSLVPQFGLEKKSNRTSGKKNVVAGLLTLRNQFKNGVIPEDVNVEIGTPKFVSSSTINESSSSPTHNGPQFMLPQISPHSCPSSPSNIKIREKTNIPIPPSNNTGGNNLRVKPSLSDISSTSPTSSQLSPSMLTNSRANLSKVQGGGSSTPTPNVPLRPMIKSKKTPSLPTIGVTISEPIKPIKYSNPLSKSTGASSAKQSNDVSNLTTSSKNLPPPPQRKRPLSQEFKTNIVHKQQMTYSKDVESIQKKPRPLPSIEGKLPIRSNQLPNQNQNRRGGRGSSSSTRGASTPRNTSRGGSVTPRENSRGRIISPTSNIGRGTPSKENRGGAGGGRVAVSQQRGRGRALPVPGKPPNSPKA